MTTDLTRTVEVLRGAGSWIVKREGLCGGEACIRGRRYPVWMLVAEQRLGRTDREILDAHPDLTAADLETAWEYQRHARLEIERALWRNTADATRQPGGIPVPVLVRGRQLGLSDEEIRETFAPPLSQAVLDGAWAEFQRDPGAVERAMKDVLPPELIEV